MSYWEARVSNLRGASCRGWKCRADPTKRKRRGCTSSAWAFACGTPEFPQSRLSRPASEPAQSRTDPLQGTSRLDLLGTGMRLRLSELEQGGSRSGRKSTCDLSPNLEARLSL